MTSMVRFSGPCQLRMLSQTSPCRFSLKLRLREKRREFHFTWKTKPGLIAALLMRCKFGLGKIANMTLSSRTMILLLLNLLSAGSMIAAQQARPPVTTDINVEAADLLARPVGENWTSYNGDYTGRRYSNLRDINAGNVAQLR